MLTDKLAVLHCLLAALATAMPLCCYQLRRLALCAFIGTTTASTTTARMKISTDEDFYFYEKCYLFIYFLLIIFVNFINFIIFVNFIIF